MSEVEEGSTVITHMKENSKSIKWNLLPSQEIHAHFFYWIPCILSYAPKSMEETNHASLSLQKPLKITPIFNTRKRSTQTPHLLEDHLVYRTFLSLDWPPI